jgi:Fur family ferric uptake transcriptional regulator
MKSEGCQIQTIHSLKDALNRCQELGLRMSRQRRLILDLLWQEKKHLSAKQVYELLSQQGKNIGLTSVYHNLEILSEHGIIECLDRHDGRLYGNYGGEHSHVNVIDTNQIMNVEVELPKELIKTIEAKTGIKIAHYRIDFYGYQNQSCTTLGK